MDSIKVFSPGSVTNLSCGYDVLGVCLENRLESKFFRSINFI